MNVLILGGMSPRHKEWVREAADALKPHFNEVKLLDYRHWDKEGTEMDLEHEITRAAGLAKDLGEYIIVAKSIGTVIATLATARGLMSPKRCLFMGFPLKAVQTDMPEVADALANLPSTTFLHNAQDPLGSAEDVGKYVRSHAIPENYVLMTVEGDTHEYTDFVLITQLSVEGLRERLNHPYYQPD